MMNKLKFGHGRRTSAKQRKCSGGGGGVHSIQSIMVGTPKKLHNNNSINRSTQVLVNEGTICASSSLDLDTTPAALEATENNSSTASSAAASSSFASGGDCCSFASGGLSQDQDGDEDLLVDPYLDSDLQRQARDFDRLELANSRPLEESSFQLSPEDDDSEQEEENEGFQEMNPKSLSLFRRRRSSSTPKVITLNNPNYTGTSATTTPHTTTTTTPKNFPTTAGKKQTQKGGTLYTGATGPESDLEDDDHPLPPKPPHVDTSNNNKDNNNENSNTTSSSAKLKSLGTFDFPEAEPQSNSNTKSLVSGSFPIPVSDEEEKADESADSFPALEYSFIQSPISVAIGKGLKLVSASLTLPTVLFTTDRDEPPPTPVSQTSIVEEEEHHNPRKSARMTRLQQQAEHECDFWNATVTQLMRTHGKSHRKVAEALLQLGQAYMLAREYAQAVIAFQSACRIWKQLERTEDDKLAFARYIDAIGMAWARVTQEEDQDHCHKAMTALEEAFTIRFELLGPWHIDTVETLNKMASVHLHLREYKEACNAYWEVFWVRKAIFGPDHPSVAIAAHALGNVFVKLASTEDAANFFQIAVEIYDKMHLPNKHPAVVRLMRDYKRLDRICLTSRLPPHKARKPQR